MKKKILEVFNSNISIETNKPLKDLRKIFVIKQKDFKGKLKFFIFKFKKGGLNEPRRKLNRKR
jgi:hypothetical protein